MIEIDQKLFITSLNAIAATDDGKIVLACLKDSCRWEHTYLSSENPQATQFYAAQRGIYGALRKFIRIEYLKEIEFNYKRKENEPGAHKRTSKPANKPTKPNK